MHTDPAVDKRHEQSGCDHAGGDIQYIDAPVCDPDPALWKKAVQSQEETEKILRSTEGENRSKRAQVFKIIIDAENKQWYTECNTDGRTELMELYVTKNQKKLRCGITTGTCCTAAALASARLLFCICGNKVNGQEEAVN